MQEACKRKVSTTMSRTLARGDRDDLEVRRSSARAAVTGWRSRGSGALPGRGWCRTTSSASQASVFDIGRTSTGPQLDAALALGAAWEWTSPGIGRAHTKASGRSWPPRPGKASRATPRSELAANRNQLEWIAFRFNPCHRA